ncbi:MAG: NAD-dependent epimerase/dehydratase family protein [Actinomycetota bacterium]|nr:NAD-dependent epimerase/dehydratase family protein [Actinomycetota bacterium]
MNEDTVLVTGGTGFLATHLIVALARDGYRVRTTVRDPGRAHEVRDALADAGLDGDVGDGGIDLAVVAADLSVDAGWDEALDGVRYVHHVASPFPPALPEDDDEVIVPARDGTLRVLRAAIDAGVERVVMTSSFAAVGYGHPPTDEPFTEEDWTDLDAPLSAYVRSKAVAERAAWDLLTARPDTDTGTDTELTVVNPVGIFGPPATSRLSASVALARQLLSMPAVPRLATTVVDVRDAADLHLRAMTSPDAAGERFLASTGEPITFQEMARILREAVTPDAPIPDVLDDETVREAARVDPGMAGMVGELGKVRRVSSDKARRTLGWEPRANAEALRATALALRDLGLLEPARTAHR